MEGHCGAQGSPRPLTEPSARPLGVRRCGREPRGARLPTERPVPARGQRLPHPGLDPAQRHPGQPHHGLLHREVRGPLERPCHYCLRVRTRVAATGNRGPWPRGPHPCFLDQGRRVTVLPDLGAEEGCACFKSLSWMPGILGEFACHPCVRPRRNGHPRKGTQAWGPGPAPLSFAVSSEVPAGEKPAQLHPSGQWTAMCPWGCARTVPCLDNDLYVGGGGLSNVSTRGETKVSGEVIVPGSRCSSVAEAGRGPAHDCSPSSP